MNRMEELAERKRELQYLQAQINVITDEAETTDLRYNLRFIVALRNAFQWASKRIEQIERDMAS